MYAVIKTGGKQYRRRARDTIRIERVDGKSRGKGQFWFRPGCSHRRQEDLAGADAGKASVSGKIVSQGRAKKLTVLKFKKGGQYKISRGHRQELHGRPGRRHQALVLSSQKLKLWLF